MLADTTLYRQHAPPAKQPEVGPVRGLEVEVQDSVSRHVPCTMERLKKQLSVLCSR